MKQLIKTLSVKLKAGFLFSWLLFFSVQANAIDIYVSPKGNDNNIGSKENPLASVSKAKNMAYKILESGNENKIIIWLSEGIYSFAEPLNFEPLNPVNKDFKIIIKAERGSNPVFSGGINISGWTKNKEGLWESALPQSVKETNCRELFINGKRAKRARFPNNDFLRVQKVGADRRTNFYFEKGDFPIPENVKNVELVFLHDWSITRIGVNEIDLQENKLTAMDTIGTTSLDFFRMDGWEPNPRYFLENAPEFIDVDYEFAFIKSERKLLLKLPENLNPEDLNIAVPVSEGLIKLTGKESNPVRNINFEGITFQYSKWEIPDLGYCGVQACHYDPRPANTGWNVVPSAIYSVWAENVAFENCTVKNTGGSGLWFGAGCKKCSVKGSDFVDISGNGIMIGEGRDREVNGGKWWQKSPDQAATTNNIENCTVTDCGKQFYGAVGVWCGLVAETTIKNNQIYNLPYTGISIGWMWSPVPTPCKSNTIEGNHIHHIMQILSDGGGIYSLGLQPGSIIRNNNIHDVQINAGRAESNGMFLDEGTTDIVIESNLIYNIAKSPLRFHKATKNLVKGNYLFCTNDNPPIRYNSTKEDDIKKVDNLVFDQGDSKYKKELEKAIEKWK